MEEREKHPHGRERERQGEAGMKGPWMEGIKRHSEQVCVNFWEERAQVCVCVCLCARACASARERECVRESVWKSYLPRC